MTHSGHKERTDISGAEVLCSRISAAYKDDTPLFIFKQKTDISSEEKK